jgi:hypothetical protein
MGYTHYWKSREATPAEWHAMHAAAREILNRAAVAGIALAGWDGSPGTAPETSVDRIALNGKGAGSHESFTLAADGSDDFCKTNHKPYDAVVVALLMVAARIGFLSWSSDGEGTDHEAGALLAADLP